VPPIPADDYQAGDSLDADSAIEKDNYNQVPSSACIALTNAYLSRPKISVMEDINTRVELGLFIALVG
jgi:hypothetical protein